jgi:hypothetical protein
MNSCKDTSIVGIVPGDFELPAAAEAWIPVSGSFDIVGRLRPGYTAADAKRELDQLLLETNPDAWSADSRLTAVVHSLSDVVVGRIRPALVALLSAALLVFLIAALNLSGILVVRTVERRQEFALRRALG